MQNEKLKIRLARFPGAVPAFLAACCLVNLLQFAPASAAETPPQTDNRFLFIINTSSAMRRETNGVQQAVLGLLKSGMQGQMRDGDTFGLWTYDDQLHTDFPMQVWSRQNQDLIVDTVSGFLGGQRYRKRPHLEKVLPAMREIIASSRVITIIFIFDGSESLRGTGFDQGINALHKEFGRRMRAGNIPFVTLLAAWNGKVFDFSVNTPAPVRVPETADLLPRPVTNAVAAVAAPSPATNAVPAPKPPEPRHLDIVLSPTPPDKTNAPVAASASVERAGLEKPVPTVQPAPAPVEIPVPVAATPAQPDKAAVVSPVAIPPRAVETPKPEPPAQSEPRIAAQETSQPPVTPAAAPPVVTKTPVQAGPVAAPPPVHAAPPAGTAAAPSQRPAPLAVQTAVAMPSPGDHIALLVIAFSLLTIAVVLILFLVRRSRRIPSLITQSMDRPR
jgi:hypothetical protein